MRNKTTIVAIILFATVALCAFRIPSSVVNLGNLSTTQTRGLAWQVGQVNAQIAAQPSPQPTPWAGQAYADKVCGDVFDSYDQTRVSTLNAQDSNIPLILQTYRNASTAQQQAARQALGLP